MLFWHAAWLSEAPQIKSAAADIPAATGAEKAQVGSSNAREGCVWKAGLYTARGLAPQSQR